VDFIFMLTRQDRTITDCLAVLDLILPLKLRHIGFKDVGVDKKTLAALAERIRKSGATTYMEVVSTSPAEANPAPANVRRDSLISPMSSAPLPHTGSARCARAIGESKGNGGFYRGRKGLNRPSRRCSHPKYPPCGYGLRAYRS
jgi:hypothetical protein